MQVERAWNPIALCDDNVVSHTDKGLSPNQIIEEMSMVFSRPVMCMVDGQFWSRRDWNCPVPAGGVVRFVELPRNQEGGSNPLKIIATIAVVVISAYTGGLAAGAYGAFAGSLVSSAVMIGGTLLLNMFFGNGIDEGSSAYGTPDTIYSVTGSSNRLRIGQPFAEHFGRMICYPDLVQASYTRMEGNEMYLYFLGIIGVGSYEIEGVYINKTPISDYSEASYAIVVPGNTPSIVTDVVWTSLEISGQDLRTEYLTAIVSGSGTVANFIEYDIQFPNLIGYNDKGEKFAVSVTTIAEVRLIDYMGVATSSWTELHRRTYTASSKDSLRYSNKIPVPLGPGRYEFRIRRTSPISGNSQISNRASIVGLRAYGGKHPDYGDITLLEAKIRATDQLNGDVSSKINVVGTRKLRPVTDVGFGLLPEATRSIVDAIAYIATSNNGGMQAETFLRFDVLNGIKTKLDQSLGHWFDWRFTGRTTVMDACSKAAKCGRSVPYMPGGQLCLARDDFQELPKMVFTDDDIDEGSLNITNTFPTVDSYTCVRVKYIDENTWQDEEVVYYDAHGSELIPYDLALDGCTVRQQAWETAAYLYRDMFLNTVNVEFTSGLKGHLPALFNKLAIAATNVDWGQNGKIVAVESGFIWLSEPVSFKGETEGHLYITAPAGNSEGPYTVTATDNPYCVAGSIADLKTLQADDLKATSFLFGPVSIDPLQIRLMGIVPQGRNRVKLFGTIVNDTVYDLPGPVGDPGTVILENEPLIGIFLSYNGLAGSDNEFVLTWTGSAVKFKIELDTGSGYTTLEDDFTLYKLIFTTAADDITVKITPYSEDTLLPEYELISSYTVVPAPIGLTLDNADADSVEVSWTAVPGADSYEVSLWADGENQGGQSVTETTTSLTTDEMAVMGGPWPDFEIHVATVIGNELSTAAVLAVSIPPMAAPTGLALQSVLSGGVMLSWNSVTNATGYKVYVGTTAGFDPATEGTMVYSGSELSGLAVVDVAPPYTYYFKVAGTNGYYQAAADLVFSTALEVSAT